MENKESKGKWKTKNNGTVFGLCLVGVAAFSVLLAAGQVKQAQKAKEEMANEQQFVQNNENDAISVVPQVEEALQNALEEPQDNMGEELYLGDEEVQMMKEASAGGIALEGTTESETDLEAEMIRQEGEKAEEESDGTADMGVAVSSSVVLPTVTFTEADTLRWPVAGSVVLDYSMDGSIYFPTLQQYKYNPALVIGSDEGTQVLSSARGIVESIVTDGETGTTVTMSLGNGYKLKYGQLQNLTVTEGDVINEGELIGYVSQPTKYYCTEGANLYFAMTKDEKPVDPVLYLE